MDFHLLSTRCSVSRVWLPLEDVREKFEFEVCGISLASWSGLGPRDRGERLGTGV
jgi:hypothetical protein